MKFNTKLVITSVTIIILPFLLALLSYWIVGMTLSFNLQDSYGIEKVPISVALNPVEVYNQVTDDYFILISDMADSGDGKIEDLVTLKKMDDELGEISSHIIVKKDDLFYYVAKSMKKDPVISYLPEYGNGNSINGEGYYFNRVSRVVKQKDFIFSDGSQGSIYLVTNVNLMVSEMNLSGVFISLFCVLILTSILLTAWLRQSIFKPFNELKQGIKNISCGNFEEPLSTDEKGEIGELFEDFEIMRLELKNTADEKRESERMNQELVSNISHDLKTPITSIKGYVEGIMDGVADSPEKMDRYIRTIYNKANDMDHLIDELTVYSRIDANKVPYQFHKILLDDYFADCADEVGLDLESRGLTFEYQNKVSKDVSILADPEQLKRVINNIINNSVKYSNKEEGRIRLDICDKEDLIEIQIADNGQGISEEEAGKIFDRFYRTDASRNSSKGGSGIGLSIARKIVEDHGGEIWATGEVGKGVCIHFTLRKFMIAVPEEEVVNEENPIQKLEKLIKNAALGIRNEAGKAVSEIEKKTKKEKAVSEIEKKTKKEKADKDKEKKDRK